MGILTFYNMSTSLDIWNRRTPSSPWPRSHSRPGSTCSGLLVKHEPDGLLAGDVANELAVPHNTMSSHLAILTRARARRRRCGTRRSIVYRANLTTFETLTLFLLQDCCGGKPELCESLIESIKPCCRTERKRHVRASVRSRV